MPLRFFVVLFLSLSSAAVAQDIDGGQDHPLISRFPNTSISAFFESEFERSSVATGPITEEIHQQQGRTALPPVERHEGNVTSITYIADSRETSPLAIFSNYERAFDEEGFTTTFQCESDLQCGERFVTQLYWYGDPQRQGRHKGLDAPNVNGSRHTYFYWTGEHTIDQTQYIVSLLVTQHTNGSFPSKIVIDVNEVDVLDDGQIDITPDELSSQLETEGRVVLDGIYFAFDSAELDPRSEASIAVVGELLRSQPTEKFYVVGHTDSVGALEYNQGLSLARAQSVVSALRQEFNINSTRILPFGVGPISPISTNQTDAGRALNRRVELVLRAE